MPHLGLHFSWACWQVHAGLAARFRRKTSRSAFNRLEFPREGKFAGPGSHGHYPKPCGAPSTSTGSAPRSLRREAHSSCYGQGAEVPARAERYLPDWPRRRPKRGEEGNYCPVAARHYESCCRRLLSSSSNPHQAVCH